MTFFFNYTLAKEKGKRKACKNKSQNFEWKKSNFIIKEKNKTREKKIRFLGKESHANILLVKQSSQLNFLKKGATVNTASSCPLPR